MKELLRKIYWLLSYQFGIDPRRMIRSVIGVPHFVRDLIVFRKRYNGKIVLLPCLHDWHEDGGSTKSEYFWQDIYVAQQIHVENPDKHVDIGSRIDGFVAHVASFRKIEVFDIRPVNPLIPNVVFRQADLMMPLNEYNDYCDSISCLHALEHFGLGRYGDPIDPFGHISGLKNISKILKKNGLLYLSVPIGVERVEFNANRVFNPKALVELAASNGLVLRKFASIGKKSALAESNNAEQDIKVLAEQPYTLGIFIFVKQ